MARAYGSRGISTNGRKVTTFGSGVDAGRISWQADGMCRNIRTLHNFEPPATADEIHASALQYVRKISGMNKPSAQNADAFDAAVEAITMITHKLVHSLKTTAPPKDREIEAAKARARSAERYAVTK
jgi:hypothetical protein